MNGHLPTPNYPIDREWRWPWWKFKLPPDALFTTLHERFNTRSCPIQDPQAFLLDVRDCAEASDDVEEFYAKLAERRDQRVRELERAWEETSSLMSSMLLFETICGNPDCEDRQKKLGNSKNDTDTERWGAFGDLVRHMSFDRLISFFDGFVRDKRENDDERMYLAYTRLGLPYQRKLGYEVSGISVDCAAAEAVTSPNASKVHPLPDDVKTDTMQSDNPIRGGGSSETQPNIKIPTPPPASSTPPQGHTTTQRESKDSAHPQDTATTCGNRKKSRSSSIDAQRQSDTQPDSTLFVTVACRSIEAIKSW
ncbi:hypothetical protein VTH06DRAFT_5605 [Thermothelomyces fergusii]